MKNELISWLKVMLGTFVRDWQSYIYKAEGGKQTFLCKSANPRFFELIPLSQILKSQIRKSQIRKLLWLIRKSQNC
jgi:hypothetical protein